MGGKFSPPHLPALAYTYDAYYLAETLGLMNGEAQGLRVIYFCWFYFLDSSAVRVEL